MQVIPQSFLGNYIVNNVVSWSNDLENHVLHESAPSASLTWKTLETNLNILQQYRNQLSLQQDARLHLQREALQQRQAELRSVDQRILELQGRLHRKKASNLQQAQQQQTLQSGTNISSNAHPPANIHVR